ncbi:GGDEF domain-containing protein [Virgisporangium ochraceum]|uniref:GGDEF domain-containing protein n=1 Tax=Virgisporangium ochraceum TaxID=65505 RepID=A0A8J3ZZZ4_9ACTN|nr:GGDEF domain-containing protein [Virgisporangium ochraceum]
MGVLYLATPRSVGWEIGFQSGLSFACGIAMLAGLRRMPVHQRWPWALVTVGVLSAAVGPIPAELDTDWFPGDGPDIADVFYLAFYPAAAAGLVLMIRKLRRRTDWAAVVDALTVTVGIALFLWAYAIAPVLRDATTLLSVRVVAVAYPVGDLLLLALTILLLRSSGRQGRRAPLIVATAIGLYLAGDWLWVVLPLLDENVVNAWLTDRLINYGYLLSFALLASATVRTGVQDDGPAAPAVSQISRAQLVLLTGAVLISPGLMIAEQVSGDIVDGYAIAIGSAAMFLLVMSRFTQLLKQAERQSQVVHEMSRRDELTGLPNRRAWAQEVPQILGKCKANGVPVSVGMIDLDRFKMFNDTYGHPAGDRLLKEAAAAWNEQVRHSDVLARYGGEEFLVLLPGAGTAEAAVVLERLRPVTPMGQTFSAGLATWDHAETLEMLVARADRALYTAKADGRDRICYAPAPGDAASGDITSPVPA